MGPFGAPRTDSLVKMPKVHFAESVDFPRTELFPPVEQAIATLVLNVSRISKAQGLEDAESQVSTEPR